MDLSRQPGFSSARQRLLSAHPDWARESAVLVFCGKIAVWFAPDQVIAAKGRARQIELVQRMALEEGRVVSVRR